jgi:hypothetical protein
MGLGLGKFFKILFLMYKTFKGQLVPNSQISSAESWSSNPLLIKMIRGIFLSFTPNSARFSAVTKGH